jgi:hypothetical protein
MSKPKYITLGLLVAMMALLIVGLMFSQRSAQADTPVDTGATVVPSGAAPEIECKWELPDMQSGFSDSTFPDSMIQYGTSGNAHMHDDDMAQPPIGSFTDAPCERDTGDPNSKPQQNQDAMKMIQVLPNGEDDPEEVWVQLWMAVDQPAAVADVKWRIYHPDNSFKVKVHGTRVGGPTGATRSVDCEALGSSTQAGNMFEAAVHTGQITADAVDNDMGLVRLCQENVKGIYYAKFQISKEQPCGKYWVEGMAVANGGATATLNNYIDVICFYMLEIDFDDIDWGDITQGVMKVVGGDLNFDPTDSAFPTVKNTGNHGMGVGVLFSEMVEVVQAGGPPVPGAAGNGINEFDACFGIGAGAGVLQCIGDVLDSNGQPVAPILSGDSTLFDDNPNRVLCSNQVGKLDLSIHPPQNISSGIYEGTVTVLARFVHIPCNSPLDDIDDTDQEIH